MQLNGATLNRRRLNVGSTIYPNKFSADSIGIVASALDGRRYANGSASAVAEFDVEFLASMTQYLFGDMTTSSEADMAPNALRGGSGQGVVEVGGGLFYTRIVYGYGGAEVRVIAISDVGVVYGDGSGVAMPLAGLDGSRVRTGSGSSASSTHGELSASAIRVPSTKTAQDLIPLISQLDTAHITAGGIRYINSGADAYAYLEIEDRGMRRQVFIGSIDLEPFATGYATAVRHGDGEAVFSTHIDATFESVRSAYGEAHVRGHAELSGEVLVRFGGAAVIQLAARLTGYVYRRGGVLAAISRLAAELDGKRAKTGNGQAVAVTIMDVSPNLRRLSSGSAVVELNAESTATDFNFVGEDDDTEVFYRPSLQREFYRSAIQREWRRS